MIKSVPALILIFISLIPVTSAQQDQDFISEGKATFYADKFHGRRTASGEIFNMYDFTAAHRTLPFNTYVNVVNLKNHKNVIVKINDRGPYVKNRIIDLTESGAKYIGGFHAGVVPVKLEVLDLFRLSPKLEDIFTSSDIIDCLGNPAQPEGVLLSLWSTTDLVHMVYMAGDRYLKEDSLNVYVAPVHGSGPVKYHLLVGSFKDKDAAGDKMTQYKSEGFKYTQFFYP